MQRRTLFIAALGTTAAALLAACATPPDIRRDKDPSVDLRSYKTFAFFDPVGTDGLRYTTLVSTRLKQATREQMERLQYVYDERHPDLLINFRLAVVDRQEISSAGSYRMWGGRVDTHSYRQGTLRIDLVDAERNLLVWQAIAEGRITEEMLKQPGPVLEQIVGEVFTDLAAKP